MNDPFVIVGGGLAAGSAVVALRDGGYDGRLVLHCAEDHLPYERPPLSKGHLAGSTSLDELWVRPSAWYAEHDVELHLGSRVEALDLDRHLVRAEGSSQRYAQLLLATGASPRRFPAADDSGAPVTYLRTIEDSHRIREALRPGARIALVGGGFIGLEVAATAREAGAEVTLVEPQSLPLLGVLGSEMAAVFAQLHRDHGVDLRLGVGVETVRSVDGTAVLGLSHGPDVVADLAVVGIGAVPELVLAVSAGLTTAGGIVVDDRLRTSDPDVFAAGDVAEAPHRPLGRHLRVEHWHNAIAQGRVAARNMLGDTTAYDELPYFFTDQYDLGMEYVGHVDADGYDEVVVRGDIAARVFTSFWIRDRTVLAAMQVNDWDATDELRRLVGSSLDLADLRDPGVSLTSL